MSTSTASSSSSSSSPDGAKPNKPNGEQKPADAKAKPAAGEEANKDAKDAKEGKEGKEGEAKEGEGKEGEGTTPDPADTHIGSGSETVAQKWIRRLMFWMGFVAVGYGALQLVLDSVKDAGALKDPHYLNTTMGSFTASLLPMLVAFMPDLAKVAFEALPPLDVLDVAGQDITNTAYIQFAFGLCAAYARHPDLCPKIIADRNTFEIITAFFEIPEKELAIMALSLMHMVMSSNPETTVIPIPEIYGRQLLHIGTRSQHPECQNLAIELLQYFLITHPDFIRQFGRRMSARERQDLFQIVANSAATFQEQGHRARAVNLFKQALELELHAPLLVQVGVELGKMGLIEESREYLGKALVLDPNRLEPAYVMALANVTPTDPTATITRKAMATSVSMILKGLKEYDEYEKTKDVLVDINTFAFDQAQDKSYEHLKKLLFEPPPAPNVPCLSSAYDLLVKLLTQLGRKEEAMYHARMWTARLHSEPAAYIAVSKLLADQGKYDQAIAELELAMVIKPSMPEIFTELAVNLFKLGNFDEASKVAGVASAKAEAQIHQFIDRVKELRQKALDEEKENQGKMDYLKSFFKSQPIDAPVDVPRAFHLQLKDSELTRALSLYRLNKYSDAEEAFKTVVRIDPYSARGFFGLGTTLRGQERINDSNECLERALDLWTDQYGRERDAGKVGNLNKFFEAYPLVKQQVEWIGKLCDNTNKEKDASYNKMCNKYITLRKN